MLYIPKQMQTYQSKKRFSTKKFFDLFFGKKKKDKKKILRVVANKSIKQ